MSSNTLPSAPAHESYIPLLEKAIIRDRGKMKKLPIEFINSSGNKASDGETMERPSVNSGKLREDMENNVSSLRTEEEPNSRISISNSIRKRELSLNFADFAGGESQCSENFNRESIPEGSILCARLPSGVSTFLSELL